MKSTPLHRLTLAIAVLLASLSLVAWRQGRAYDLQRDLEAVRDELELARTHQDELEAEETALLSRDRIVRDARDLLGLRPPDGQVLFLSEEGS